MSELKQTIFNEIKAAGSGSEKITNEQLEAHMFVTQEGLRLSYSGLLLMQEQFTSHVIDISGITFKSRHLIAISNLFKYPYYLSKKKLILFSESDAIMIQLSGGVEAFLTLYE
jgi:hypothetical protein